MGEAERQRRQHLGMAEAGQRLQLERDRIGRQAAAEAGEQRHHLGAEFGIEHQQARRRPAGRAEGL